MSRVGLADCLRFYHARPTDFNIHEIVSIYTTLPSNSATTMDQSDSTVSMTDQLIAVLIDQVRGLAAGLGGKRLKSSDRISTALTKEAMRKRIDDERMKEELKDQVRRLNNQN